MSEHKAVEVVANALDEILRPGPEINWLRESRHIVKALETAGLLVEGESLVCAWCPHPARGSAWHNDGKLHPSCGQIGHGGGWVPPHLSAAEVRNTDTTNETGEDR